MGWLSNLIDTVHGITKYADPLGHALVDTTNKVTNQSVSSISGLLGDVGSALGISTSLPDNVAKHADQNKQNLGLSAERSAAVASLVYGGVSALGEGGAVSGGTVGSDSLGSTAATGTYTEAGGGTVSGAADGGLSYTGGYDAAGKAITAGGTGAEGVGASTEPSLLSKAANSSTTKQVGTALISQGINAALAPKQQQQAPQARPVVEMPDPLAQAEARRRKLADQLARRGRVSTIMTSDGG